MAQTARVKERQAAQAQRIKQAQAFLVPDHIDVAILGGGAAGLCAAITAAEALGTGKHVVVFEKALETGRTILATGGGRCNFTNADLSFENFSHPEFVQAVCKDKNTFLADILSFFRSSGLAWATEDEGRMYPLTRQASSIQSLLLKRAQKAGVQFALGREVTSVKPQHIGFTVTFQECFGGEKTYKVHASSVVLATGGLTTTQLAESLQLQTTSLRPGLCALTCKPEPPTSLDGKRVRAHAALVRDGAVLKQESGELLFRSFGLSGIMIFNLSRTALPGDVLEIDLLPQLTEEEVAAAVEAHTTDGLLDPQIAAYLGAHDSVETTIAKAHKITFTVTGTSSKVVSQVCIGGISIDQVDSNTLEAYGVPGLFIAGEALDIDAQCGGFNLSWAWKSGMVVGLAAAKSAGQDCESLKEATNMLEVSNIKVHVAPLRKHPAKESKVGFDALLRALRVSADEITSYELHKRSIDARKRNDIVLILTYHVNLKGGPAAEQKLLSKIQGKPAAKHIKLAEPNTFALPKAMQPAPSENRPVVVGAGCAGLFCALTLAKAGLNPLLIERGDDATRRTAAVEHHNQTGQLDLESNIQFGLGGAGTFSDGKLNTGTKSASHRFILETFVKAGAQKNILWDAKPHVGSDVLPTVVTNIVKMIEDAGGTVAFRTKLTSLERASDGSLSAIQIERTTPDGSVQTETIRTRTVILATGHSSRDTYVMLKDKGISMERKTFAMGVRIEHLQSQINKSLYGPEATNPVLGAAPYKLSVHLPSGRSAFSFCMCPGGYVVSAASEKGGVVTNGMSLSDRAGQNANSGLLANVYPDDLPGDDVLAGIELQRSCEQAAFKAGGGAYVAPAQLVGDFLSKKASTGPRSVKPTYPRGVTWTSLEDCLPPYVLQTLREALPVMDKKLHGFAHPDAVLTGVETRSSSPVRITRDETGQSINTPGVWPVGEGAGYAGGIMSAAADGIRMAELIVEHYNRA